MSIARRKLSGRNWFEVSLSRLPINPSERKIRNGRRMEYDVISFLCGFAEAFQQILRGGEGNRFRPARIRRDRIIAFQHRDLVPGIVEMICQADAKLARREIC